MANIFEINRVSNKITLGTTDTTINIASHTASKTLALDSSKNLISIQDLRTTAIPTFAGIIVADGGTIGQSAGPLLTFDDTDNILGITGCDVDIGGQVDIAYGGLSLMLGADVNALTRTNETNKFARIGIYHYTNVEEPTAMVYGICTQTINALYFGGGHSGMNAATRIRFYTAADTITTTGTIRLEITNNDILFKGPIKISEQPTADGDTGAYGQDWVKNTTPCTKWFTDDTGVDYQLSGIATEVLNGSVTWNPPNIVGGESTSSEITVNGAALGDFVLVSFSLDIQHLVLTGYVSQTNQITAILANNTGGDIDLGEGTLYARILKK